MPLPNLEKILPSFPVTVPSTNESHKFRPFLVKEEKILLMAMENVDPVSSLDAVVDVIRACSLDTLDLDQCANFDFEYLFLKIRAQSIGEIVNLAYRCHNPLPSEDDQEKFCNNIITAKLNLNDV